MSQLAIQNNQEPENFFSPRQEALFKDIYFKTATNEEVQVCMAIASKLRLDPISRQIFFIPRYDPNKNMMVITPQVSIDGFRIIAERSGEYRGQTETTYAFFYNDEDRRNRFHAGEGPHESEYLPPGAILIAAKVGVLRRGYKAPLYAVAHYEEYAQKKKNGDVTRMWLKMPGVLLSKCAESLALRKCFPNEMCGVLGSEEMEQSRIGSDEPEQVVVESNAMPPKKEEVPKLPPKEKAKPKPKAKAKPKAKPVEKKEEKPPEPEKEPVVIDAEVAPAETGGSHREFNAEAARPPAEIFAEFIAGVEMSETIEELRAVGETGSKLRKEDKGDAEVAYKSKLAELKKKKEKPSGGTEQPAFGFSS